jgi:hypothetical protein
MGTSILLALLVFCLLAVGGLLFVLLAAVMATQRFGDAREHRRRPF